MGSDGKKVDRVNRLNRAFTVIFTEAMQSLKPLKEIQKIRSNKPADPDAETYDTQFEKWQNAFSFNKELRKYVNELNNLIVLAGGSNSSTGPNDLTAESLKKIDLEINSKEFKEKMKLCEPKIEEDPLYNEKMVIWNQVFDFPEKLNGFIKKLKEQSLPIPAEKYLEQVDSFIEELQVDDDEFLIKATESIGGEEYKIDAETIEARAKSEIKTLAGKIKVTDKKTFIKVMEDAKINELEVKAEKKIIEKKYDKAKFNFEIDEELAKETAQAIKKAFPQYMNYIAVGSIVVILVLVIASATCLGCTFETISTEEIKTVETIETVISDETTLTTKTTQIINATVGDSSQETIGIVVRNPATEILESNMIMVLVSTFVAPMAARILKEKFDIDITEKQVSMIVSDGISSVTMYTKEADMLRDASGHIPRKYQKALRNKAFNAIRENYNLDKYNELIAGVGAQIFDKAIESAVKAGRLERFPLEKKQVEELIKQSIDAVPQIVEWQKLDEGEEVKNTFIDGNIRKLLQNTGVNGWSHKALENIFDAEMSKRIVGAALVLKDNLLGEFDSKDPYLKYTSTIIDAVLEREKPKTVTVTAGVQS